MNRAPALGRTPETDEPLTNLQAGLTGFLDGLVELIAARVVDQLKPGTAVPEKLLLTKQELAQAWGCSTSSVDRMRLEGLPTVLIGESPRFNPTQATAWLQSRGASR
jgi:hypothetical protein